MKLYRTKGGWLAEENGQYTTLQLSSLDDLLSAPDLPAALASARGTSAAAPAPADLLAPVGTQEVWASGVTYFRSRTARMEESKDTGGGSFYDRVYSAERPELFFKANGARVVGPGAPVRIRRDATWSVPEPELTLVINAAGKIVGYTVGNDMSSRDIEGENPLYLPQAKVYDGSCALGPCLLLAAEPMARTATIGIEIERDARGVFGGETALTELKRDPEELVHYLYRESSFPVGAFLLTGTGVVPPDDFTIALRDRVRIRIEGIGTLENTVG